MNSRIVAKVTESAISMNQVWEHAHDPAHGGQCFFTGSVRQVNLGRQVVAIEYDAAAVLAENVFQEIAGEAQKKWGSDIKVYIIHRSGKLQVGEVSVAIGVSSTHRDESFKACRYIIEQIKVRAPIWKKEFYTDGETEWVQGHALCQHNHAHNENDDDDYGHSHHHHHHG